MQATDLTESRLLQLSRCVAEIVAAIDDSRIEDELARATLNRRLADTIEKIAATKADRGRGLDAKLLACVRYFKLAKCDTNGELPIDADLVERLVWSALSDLFPENSRKLDQ